MKRVDLGVVLKEWATNVNDPLWQVGMWLTEDEDCPNPQELIGTKERLEALVRSHEAATPASLGSIHLHRLCRKDLRVLRQIQGAFEAYLLIRGIEAV